MRCAQIPIAYLAGVESIQGCFSQGSVLVNSCRAGIGFICGTHLSILCFAITFREIRVAVDKRIKPSGIFLIRGFIATE
jgi:hypothetical protein